MVLPKPWQTGQAPNGELKLNRCGSGSSYVVPSYLQMYLSENLRICSGFRVSSFGLSLCELETPNPELETISAACPSRKHVSSESTRRWRISLSALSRSIRTNVPVKSSKG